MRMTSDWFARARRYTDSPSLGKCVHHVRRQGLHPTLRKQVHKPHFTPKDWEFEVLTKLVVLGQVPAQPDESRTPTIAFLGPTLSTFDPPSEHHCAVSPKSKGERSNPNKRAGKKTSARNDPVNGSGSWHLHQWFNLTRIKRRLEHHIVRSKTPLCCRQRSQSLRRDTRMLMKASSTNV